MVSVIIPIYNGQKHISNILMDLLNQEYKDFEVIFIDDGSIDNSYNLLCNAQKDNRFKFKIKVIKQENKGVSAARNKGIENAKGDYICFVDVDDGLDCKYLLSMVEALKQYNGNLVFCQIKKNNKINCKSNSSLKLINRNECLHRFLFNKLISGVWSLMIERNIIDNNNLKFFEGYKYSEDLHMVWRLIAFSERIIELNDPLYIYNVTEGSAMSKFGIERKDSILLMEELEKFFKIYIPEFYPVFKQYGVTRMKWSLLWQAAYHFNYKEFSQFIKTNKLKEEILKLVFFKKFTVRISSLIFCISPLLFYFGIKITSRNFRKI